VHVKAENVGEVAQYLPSEWVIKLLYKGTTIRGSSKGGVKGREPYYGGKKYPGVGEEGWILRSANRLR